MRRRRPRLLHRPVRRPLVTPEIYMASGKRGVRRLYPIYGVSRLRTARIPPPHNPYRTHRPAGTSEIRNAMCFTGPPGAPGRPEYDAWARCRETMAPGGGPPGELHPKIPLRLAIA